MAAFFVQPKPIFTYIIIFILLGYIALDKILDTYNKAESNVVCPPCSTERTVEELFTEPRKQKATPETGSIENTANGNVPASGIQNTDKVPPNNESDLPPESETPLDIVQPEATKKRHCATCNVYNLSQANDFDFNCIQMKFSPPSPVCLYPVNKDIYVSGSLAAYGTWEAGMVSTFQAWLRDFPGAGVIDIGANLGVYSLVAAAMGRKVVSVEPNIENVRRYHKAIKQGHFENLITLLQNAVGDNTGIVKIVYSVNNQGDTQMRKQAGDSLSSAEIDNERMYTKMIVMDDLLEYCNFSLAIMKMDIQGFEHRAFARAELLFDTVLIPKVMMEWDMMKPIYLNKGLHPDEYALVLKMVQFFKKRKYTPKDWQGRVMDVKYWHMWPFDIVWHKNMD